jgi:hypothetical protein
MYLETETLLILTGVWSSALILIYALRRNRSLYNYGVKHLDEIKEIFARSDGVAIPPNNAKEDQNPYAAVVMDKV